MTSDRARQNGLKAVETLRKFLVEMGLAPDEGTHPEGIALKMKLEGPTPNAVARILIDKERFTVHFFFERTVPSELRMKVAEFITRANFGLIIGNFEMSFNDGTLRYKSSVDFTNTDLTEPLVRNAMLSAMDNIETFSEPLWEVLDGDLEPEEAVSAAMASIQS